MRALRPVQVHGAVPVRGETRAAYIDAMAKGEAGIATGGSAPLALSADRVVAPMRVRGRFGARATCHYPAGGQGRSSRNG